MKDEGLGTEGENGAVLWVPVFVVQIKAADEAEYVMLVYQYHPSCWTECGICARPAVVCSRPRSWEELGGEASSSEVCLGGGVTVR